VCKPGPLWLLLAAICLFFVPSSRADSTDPATNNSATVLVVIGAPGDEDFGTKFHEWAKEWEKASKSAGATWIVLDKEAGTNQAQQLKTLLAKEPKTGSGEFWLVLLGHGTFDGKEAKFNLLGPDVSPTDLATWLAPFQRPAAIIGGFSASAPFLSKLSGKTRVVITATSSGNEQNFSRFGQYISSAIADPEADLDKDGQTSLLEAYLIAARRTAEFYETEGRLATEHPLLDDNGDGLGTPPDWFRGIRAIKKAREGAQLDGLRANQFYLVRSDAEKQLPASLRERRDELEVRIGQLREAKTTMPEEEYYKKLEPMLIEMAQLYEKATGVSPK
jgi:hypothetical protein